MAEIPRIVSLVPTRADEVEWEGEVRLDRELARVFPDRLRLDTSMPSLARLAQLTLHEPLTIVITCDETALLVPQELRTIVVQRWSAQTQLNRDPTWRGERQRRLCRAQRELFQYRNRWFVSLSQWLTEQLAQQFGVPEAPVISPWVPPIESDLNRQRRRLPVVLGDWRTSDQGASLIQPLEQLLPGWRFCQLACSYESRTSYYADADVFLYLSLSGRGAFSLADAEAACLPIVCTDTGSYLEYSESHVINWDTREDLAQVARALQAAVSTPRGPSFFAGWTFASWQRAWQELVQQVADQRERQPVSGTR